MTKKKAALILGVTDQDDVKTIKTKYRKLMATYHPDSAGDQTDFFLEKAQQINEAYAVLSKPGIKRTLRKKKTPTWKSKVVPNAYIERSIYRSLYLMDDYELVARGKYAWDPDLEDFPCLLRSLNHAAIELLEGVERKHEIYSVELDEVPVERFTYQVQLFHLLARQYIAPVFCLEKMGEIAYTDESIPVYNFRTSVGTKGSTEAFHGLEQLKTGDLLYVSTIKDNRIVVASLSGVDLGYVSFEEDYWYYIIIPILQAHMGQVKFVVRDIEIKKNVRPYKGRANLDMYLRLEQKSELDNTKGLNPQIEEVLAHYNKNLC